MACWWMRAETHCGGKVWGLLGLSLAVFASGKDRCSVGAVVCVGGWIVLVMLDAKDGKVGEKKER